MNGFVAEKKHESGKSYWIVRDVDTKAAVAVGDTVTHAVENYEILMQNERIKKQLGLDLEDLSF